MSNHDEMNQINYVNEEVSSPVDNQESNQMSEDDEEHTQNETQSDESPDNPPSNQSFDDNPNENESSGSVEENMSPVNEVMDMDQPPQAQEDNSTDDDVSSKSQTSTATPTSTPPTSSTSPTGSSSSSMKFESDAVSDNLQRATCMRIRPNAGQFLAGVLQTVTRCVITSVSDVVNSIEEHDVKTAFRANQELRFLTKDCLINIVLLSSDDEI